MTPEAVMSLGQRALELTILISAPLLLSALVTGVVIGMLQAATQIHEMTLSFIPKLLVAVGGAVRGGAMDAGDARRLHAGAVRKHPGDDPGMSPRRTC